MIIGHTDSSLGITKPLRWQGWVREDFGVMDASGGVVTIDGDYKIHTFDVSGYFIVYESSYLVGIECYAGGAGGGGACQGLNSKGGGGGGGELYHTTNLILEPSIYYVTIGNGGLGTILWYGLPPWPGGDIVQRYATDGSDTTLGDKIVAKGGKKGVPSNGGNSGSGYLGGVGYNYSAGGGAGDSSNGARGDNGYAWSSQGGSGSYCNITGQYYGGGGAGGTSNGTAGEEHRSVGGIGGGGRGGWTPLYSTASQVSGLDGSTNFGGGGGGAANIITTDTGPTNMIHGGDGGSGKLIIKYRFQL